MGHVVNVALITLVVPTFNANAGRVVNVIGRGAILAALLFIGSSFAVGWGFGLASGPLRDEVALATAQRNIAAAMVVATQSIEEPDTTVMVIITSLAAMVILFPVVSLMN